MPQDLSSEQDPDDSDAEFVEVDPTGRYGRYKEILGKGAFKKVYRAFDELEGIEVAWNQVKVADLLRHSEDVERLYSEVRLLKTLKHKSIIKFYNSWVDAKNENINFITEIFTSGTLRQYRKKHKHVDVRALKKWSRQILEGLMYLHSHDPPVVHRDLKCDNIFVNGNQGEVKIGDLGLAAFLRQAQSAHSIIGTPEFMAPELYEEEYNELVDIYAFGMCLLELVTFEYPYVECANAAQIYKKVTSGIKPASLARVTDPGVRLLIEKCIAKVSDRLTAMELLMDPFLHSDENLESICHPIQFNNCDSEGIHSQINVGGNDKDLSIETSRDFMVQGQRKDINTIFLKLRIADPSGHIRNIHFPFDVEVDTAIAVASEMVEELDLTDQDVSTISEMIDIEIQYHNPGWRSIDDTGEISCGKIPTNDNDGSEMKVDASLPIESNPSSSTLALERLPSGRKYWSDSPKASNEKSPEKVSPLQLAAPVNLVTEEGSPILDNENSTSSHNNEDNTNGSASLEQPVDVPLCLHDSGEETVGPAVQTHNKNDAEEKLPYGALPLFEGFESDVKIIAQNLETLLLEQQKELDKLKKKHQSEILYIVKELSPETRSKVLDICKARVYRF